MKKVIDRIIDAKQVMLGESLINQPLPASSIDQLDPFLLIHHGGMSLKKNQEPKHAGVGPHPHRGFSPVTFVFKGSVQHKDSLGNDATVGPGGTQWMHAGRGIVHSERPGENMKDANMEHEFIQFWVNSPSKHKMDPPTYVAITEKMTPVIEKNGARIEIVAGEFEGLKGPAPSLTPQTLLRGSIENKSDFKIDIPSDYNTLIYLQDGAISVNGSNLNAKQMMVFKREGETLEISASNSAHFIVLSGKPIGEPVSHYGPFVMNTQTEIMEALRDAQMGKMGILIE